MKPMKARTTLLGGLIVTCVLTGGGAYVVGAQTHDHGSAPAPAAPATSAATSDAIKMHDQMMSQMHAREAKLDALVKTMDGATGQAKIDAMASIIRELVQSEKVMHAEMSDMHEHMMGRGEAAK